MKRNRIIILIICSFLTGIGGTYLGMNVIGAKVVETIKIAESTTPNEIVVDKNKIDKVEQTYELILKQFVEKVPEEQLIEGAIHGMLASLDDPYSVYMDKAMTERFNESFDSTFEGIGAEVSMVDGKVIIVAPFKDSPAEKAGIKPKDQILSIDGTSVEGLDLYETTLKIRGKKGSTVQLEIMREGQKRPISIKVTRDEIPFETVYSKSFTENSKRVGYIEIASFSEETAADFKTELKRLENEGMTGLIIDMRGNPGGLLSSVQDIAKQLITDKKPYVQTETRNGDKNRFFTTLTKPKSYPITILIDNGSASAAEILASALHEVEGYDLVGETTFGKGTVQHPIDMNDGSSIKLTSLKWLTADGKWIHKKGVKPTVEVSQPKLFKTMPVEITEPLRLDMNNEQIKQVQDILQSLGFAPGRNDGYFNEQTEVAVRAFQQANNLKVSGVVDEKTATVINEVVMDVINDEENDRQLQAALKLITR